MASNPNNFLKSSKCMCHVTPSCHITMPSVSVGSDLSVYYEICELK